MFFGAGDTLSWNCVDADTWEFVDECLVTDAAVGAVGCDNTCAADGLDNEGNPCGEEAATDTAAEMAQ